ncbi:MAG: cysteate synthase [Chloroflexota bacterium]|nr:cysteate synthase [Lentimicrobium sp.]
MDKFNTQYLLQSVDSGKIYNDSGWMLDEPGAEGSTLLRAIYHDKKLNLRHDADGLFKFANWLPLKGHLKGSAAPVTYKSDGLASLLGLKDLWITFNGYWPERGANMTTCSFKETEAYSVCSRLNGHTDNTLVVASAGNTARAFAKVCSDNNIPLILCVPYDYIDALWFDKQLNDCVKLYCTARGSDYFDAIALSNIIARQPGYTAEGGAKNVARRDGMGTTVLSAVSTIGRIPDFYFQAVGSGTGAIAAWEANLRLIDDGSFGKNKMRLIVSQNAPFLPIFYAWKAGSRQLLPMNDEDARNQTHHIDAKVLSNRRPPYSIKGGLFDALLDTDGDVHSITNEELRDAARVFKENEGVDIYSASAVATSSLMKSVASGLIKPDSLVMLNITGGGEQLFKSHHSSVYLKPLSVFDINTSEEEIIKAII